MVNKTCSNCLYYKVLNVVDDNTTVGECYAPLPSSLLDFEKHEVYGSSREDDCECWVWNRVGK